MNKQDKLNTEVENFIEERLNYNCCELRKNKKYQKLEQDYFNKWEEMETTFKVDWKLLDEYRSLQYDLEAMHEQEAYKTGFNDALKLFYCKEI